MCFGWLLKAACHLAVLELKAKRAAKSDVLSEWRNRLAYSIPRSHKVIASAVSNRLTPMS
jgi:hypothetical protein